MKIDPGARSLYAADFRLEGLVRSVASQVARAQFEKECNDGHFIELAIPLAKPSGYRVDMYGNEPAYHEAHVRARFGSGDGNYRITNGERLNGDIELKYDPTITKWIVQNKVQLRECWDELQARKAGRKVATHYWGSDSWLDDAADDASPAASRMILLPSDMAPDHNQNCITLILPEGVDLPSARFVAVQSQSEKVIVHKVVSDFEYNNRSWRLTPGTEVGLRNGTLLDDALVLDFSWLPENEMGILVSTLPALSIDDLVYMAA